MSTARTVIREAAITAIKNASTAAATKVYSNRTLRFTGIEELPAINVTDEEESAEPDNVSDLVYERSLTLSVEIYVAAELTTVEADIDTMATAVEGALLPSGVLGDQVFVQYDSMAKSLDYSGETLIVVMKLIFIAAYVA